MKTFSLDDKSETDQKPVFLPAINCKHGLRFYDPLVRVALREYAFKSRLIQQARLTSGTRILDAGCGTGTLLNLIKAGCPGAYRVGIDLDIRILRLARAKTAAPLTRGNVTSLPFFTGAFDWVFATLFFHHLLHDEKIRAFGEILRVLRPGGWLHAADFGKPQNWLMRVMGKLVQLADGPERTQENFAGLLPGLVERSGFRAVKEWNQRMTLFGTLALFSAQKPG